MAARDAAAEAYQTQASALRPYGRVGERVAHSQRATANVVGGQLPYEKMALAAAPWCGAEALAAYQEPRRDCSYSDLHLAVDAILANQAVVANGVDAR